ncbi:BON domain-containing protein [Paraburkholderia sp. BR10937]|uniref:BON domain-containing protein n=1 Tax=Paraburkholderia sp. BR10937 TaxID=3236994 RepID=UPI0034D2DBC2
MYSKLLFVRTAGIALCVSLSFGFAESGAWAQQPSNATNTVKSEHAADRALARSVRKALDRQKGLDIDDVRILAKHGEIGLDGTVPDGSQLQTVSSVAASVPGVKAVHSYLSVREEGN